MQRLFCDVRTLPADAVTLDALARLELTVRRAGVELCLRHASAELCCLIEFTGLGEVLRVEPRGQAEEREERLGVQEEGQFGDPAA